MKKQLVLIVVVLLLCVSMQAKKVAVLEEVMNPSMLTVVGDRLYVAETSTVSVYVYSLENYKLIKKFGKRGEGPKEFKINPFGGPGIILVADSKQLLVNTEGKISYFTRDGEYIKEVKVPPFRFFAPVKGGYVANGVNMKARKGKMMLNINLHDAEYQEVKELYISEISVGPGASNSYPTNAFGFQTHQDKIFILAGKKGLVVDVYDHTGKLLYAIQKEEKKVPLPKSYEKDSEDWFKNKSPYKQYASQFKRSYRSDYPACQSMIVDGNRLYVFTYKKKGDLTECVVMDLKGKEIKRTFVPFPEGAPDGPSFLFTIHENKMYTFVENIDEEYWELHSVEVE